LYQIRTMEDMNLDTHDAGLGWKDQQRALAQAAVAPNSIASEMRGTARPNAKKTSGSELKHIIKGALQQLGVNAQVEVDDTGGATEVYVEQEV